ncbi:cobalamin biosynthesis protein, partial [Rhodospirillum rubrum]
PATPPLGRLFDAVLVVDWSAAAQPRQGANSLWIHGLDGDDGSFTANPPTREAAMALLADRLSDRLARGRRVLLGVDFAFGYPAGTAPRLVPGDPDWRGVWKLLAARIRDGADNANNRFAVAEGLNALLDGNGPFWAGPRGWPGAGLPARRPVPPPGGLAALRLTERRTSGPHSVWKLCAPGSVGGQTLVGLPRLWRLRNHPWLAGSLRIWPFETGLRLPDPSARVVVAEVYPSLVARRAAEGEVVDETQVKALARRLWDLDGAGRLAPLFCGPADLSAGDRQLVEREEGWILGIETGLAPGDPFARPVPRVLTLGVGCESGCPAEELEDLVWTTLGAHGLSAEALSCVATLDRKAGAPAVRALARRLDRPLRLFPAQVLERETPRLASPSPAVFRAVGCHGVAEAAALAAAGESAILIVAKTRSQRATCALARTPLDAPSFSGTPAKEMTP